MKATKAKPILMSAPMVLAILEGRKTQTRRPIKDQPDFVYSRKPAMGNSGGKLGRPRSPRTGNKRGESSAIETHRRGARAYSLGNQEQGLQSATDCACARDISIGNLKRVPYEIGTILWVRETWVELLHTSPATDEPVLCPGDKLIEHATKRPDGGWYYDGRVIAYRATSTIEFCDGDGFSGDSADRDDMPKWRPSIHMPRWASRITLRITDVRVERVQEISGDDAISEGFMPSENECWTINTGWLGTHPVAIRKFQRAWNDTYAAKGLGWDANPWVWVIQFERVESEGT